MSQELVSQLTAALSLPSDSPEQTQALVRLRALFEAQPFALPHLFSTLASLLTPDRSFALRKWTASLMEIVLCRPHVPIDLRLSFAKQSLEVMARLMHDADLPLVKLGCQCFASSYPLLFREACLAEDRRLWDRVQLAKQACLQVWEGTKIGGKIASVKAVQRIIETQTRGTSDPRLRNTAEANLSLVRNGHSFLMPPQLEEQANKLMHSAVTAIFTVNHADVVTAIVAMLATLMKSRPQYGNLVVTTFTAWTPEALMSTSPVEVRSVEKAIRAALVHLLRTSSAAPFATKINDFLPVQQQRMDVAAQLARQAREAEASRKRQLLADDIEQASKRQRLGEGTSRPTAFAEAVARSGEMAAQPLATFDVKSLPVELVVELILASLITLTDDNFHEALQHMRTNLAAVGVTIPESELVLRPNASGPAEPLNPLKADLGDDDVPDIVADLPRAESEGPDEGEEDATHLIGPVTTTLSGDVELLQVSEISPAGHIALLRSSMARLCEAGDDGALPEVWAPLLSRIASRGVSAGDEEPSGPSEELRPAGAMREVLFDFVCASLHTRVDLAKLWLSEEWYASQHAPEEGRSTVAYFFWLEQILDKLHERTKNKDKSFTGFFLDLPAVPRAQIDKLSTMCTRPDQVQIGFATLRELALLRVRLRTSALDVLLSLTSHPSKLTRNAAILTVKKWVPDVSSLSQPVVAFALALFRSLSRPEDATTSQPEDVKTVVDEDTTMAADEPGDDGEQTSKGPVTVRVEGGAIIEKLPTPTTVNAVVQHAELLLALCAKRPELLASVFEIYPRLSSFVQTTLQSLITPLIKTLGSNHPQVLAVFEDSPREAEGLVLRTLAILTTSSDPSPELVDTIIGAAKKGDVSPRLLMPVLHKFEKEPALEHLHQLLSMLNGTSENTALVRSTFERLLAAPATPPLEPISLNAQARTAGLLTPVELLSILHTSDRKIGVKPTIEAINICLSMTEIYRPEVLAAFMQHLVDGTTIPILFMRTVIQAIGAHKALQPFVATTLLSRLITKKIWTTPPLWEGFVRCAKMLAPQSFPALIQLPREHLRDAIGKQMTLQPPLMEYVLKRFGPVRGQGLIRVIQLQPDEAPDVETPDSGDNHPASQGEGALPRP